MAFFVVLALGFVQAQSPAKVGEDMAISVYLDKEKSGVPPHALRLLQNKMQQIVSMNGIGGVEGQRFILTAHVNELSKDITATAPPMHAVTLEVGFYMGDGIDGVLFSSASVTCRGVGETEDKAYMAALKAVKVGDPELASLVTEGKEKIIDFYDARIDMLLKEADAKKSMQDYDGAIAVLIGVPQEAKAAYGKAMVALESIYKEKTDIESEMALNEAKSIWASGKDVESAKAACEVLAKIYPGTKASADAEVLRTEIGQRVKELDQREYDLLRQSLDREYELEKSYIEACRDVALKEAENTPDVIVYTYSWW